MSLTELIPPAFRQGARSTADALSLADQALIAAHINPDGDAIGAMLACAAIFRSLGRRFALYLPQGVPEYLHFLELPDSFYTDLGQLPFSPRWAIYVDCSQLHRLGHELAIHPNQWLTINIDHHICEAPLGNVANFVATSAAATCQLMAYVAMALDKPLTGPMGTAIAVGILTDTGFFAHGNTSAEVFDLAALLERSGICLHSISEQIRDRMSINRLKLFGALFCRTQLAANGRLAWDVAYQDDLRQLGCKAEDLEGFVDWLRRIQGVEIAMLVRELEDGHCKFSLRSSGATDVQGIAASLGGGGHRNASGGTLPCAPAQGVQLLQDAVENYFQHSPEVDA